MSVRVIQSKELNIESIRLLLRMEKEFNWRDIYFLEFVQKKETRIEMRKEKNLFFFRPNSSH